MGLLLAMIPICCAVLICYFTSLHLSSLSYKMSLILRLQWIYVLRALHRMLTVLVAINIVTVHEKSSYFLIYKPKTTKPGIFLKVIYFF